MQYMYLSGPVGFYCYTDNKGFTVDTNLAYWTNYLELLSGKYNMGTKS